MSSLSQFFGGQSDLKVMRIYACSAARFVETENTSNAQGHVSGFLYVGDIPIPRSGLTVEYEYETTCTDVWRPNSPTLYKGQTRLKIGDSRKFEIAPGQAIGTAGRNVSNSVDDSVENKVGYFPYPARPTTDDSTINVASFPSDPVTTPAPFGTIYSMRGWSGNQGSVPDRPPIGLNYYIPELDAIWCQAPSERYLIPNGQIFDVEPTRTNRRGCCMNNMGYSFGVGRPINFANDNEFDHTGAICIAYSNSIGEAVWTTTTLSDTYLGDQRVYLTDTDPVVGTITGTFTIPAY